MSQDLYPSTCSSLVIFMYWACKNHNQEVAKSLVFAVNRTYCTFFLWRFTSRSKLHRVVIEKAEQQVRKASYCRTKQ